MESIDVSRQRLWGNGVKNDSILHNSNNIFFEIQSMVDDDDDDDDDDEEEEEEEELVLS